MPLPAGSSTISRLHRRERLPCRRRRGRCGNAGEQSPLGDQLFDGRGQLIGVEWFPDKGITFPYEIVITLAAHEYHGDLMGGRLALESEKNLMSTHARHSHIAEDGVWTRGAHQFKAGGPGVRQLHLETTGGQECGGQFAHHFIIVDYDNFTHS